MPKTWIRYATAAVAMTAALVGAARAQVTEAWPSRPIKLVVAGAPASGNDLIARLIAERLAKVLQQPIVIDNKPGASGILSSDAVAKAAPDGYTLLFSNASATVMLQAFEPKLPYNLTRDLIPVTQVGAGGVLMVVGAEVPVSDLRELVALVKANPARYATYATWGIGSSGHLLMEAVTHQSGLHLSHVPYKSTPQVIQDLVGGQLQIGWVDVSSSAAMIRAGKIKPIAISGSHRIASYPNVATLFEQGYPLKADGWYGIFAPAGVRPELVTRLNAEINRIVASPEMRERLAQFNLADFPQRTPEQFKQKIGEDIKTWRSIVVENGIKADE